jgi:hypothetical protein
MNPLLPTGLSNGHVCDVTVNVLSTAVVCVLLNVPRVLLVIKGPFWPRATLMLSVPTLTWRCPEGQVQGTPWRGHYY